MKLQKIKYWLIPLIVILVAVMVPLLPVFNIKTIKVETEYGETAEKLAAASGLKAGANMFLTLLGKGNILSMRFTGAEQEICRQFTEYGDVRVRAVFPSTVLIEYSTKEPVFEIQYGESILVTDINGCVLESRTDHELGYLRLTGIDIDGFSIGCIIGDNTGKLELAADIYTEMKSYDEEFLTAFCEYIDWIDLSNPSGLAMMFDGRILVKIDPTGDVAYQTASMCDILALEIRRNEKGTLDFTSGDLPVFSPE